MSTRTKEQCVPYAAAREGVYNCAHIIVRDPHMTSPQQAHVRLPTNKLNANAKSSPGIVVHAIQTRSSPS